MNNINNLENNELYLNNVENHEIYINNILNDEIYLNNVENHEIYMNNILNDEIYINNLENGDINNLLNYEINNLENGDINNILNDEIYINNLENGDINNIENGEEYLYPFFNTMGEQKNFINMELKLFNKIYYNPNVLLNNELQCFLVNHDYTKFWKWGLYLNLENQKISLNHILNYLDENVDYINNIEQIRNVINNFNYNNDYTDIVNILTTLPIKYRMELYMINMIYN